MAAMKLESATLKLFSGFRPFSQAGRIGKLHLHSRNGGHGEIAAPERLGDQC
jgi:hypothetical protein